MKMILKSGKTQCRCTKKMDHTCIYSIDALKALFHFVLGIDIGCRKSDGNTLSPIFVWKNRIEGNLFSPKILHSLDASSVTFNKNVKST